LFCIGGTTTAWKDAPHEERDAIRAADERLGAAIQANPAHRAVICSPHEDSLDLYVLRGIAAAGAGSRHIVEVHFPRLDGVERALKALERTLGLDLELHSYALPRDVETPSPIHVWLVAQLQALQRSEAVIALGGRPDGSSYTLLSGAEARGDRVVPAEYLGGAAGASFHRLRQALERLSAKDFRPSATQSAWRN
jgi:hypothetical protein